MIHTPTSREHWLELRKSFVTSTEVAALFGLSPYQTALELALIKTGDIEDGFSESLRTRWGTRLQESIAQGVADDYGVMCQPQPGFATLDDCKLGASFDWEVIHTNDEEIDDNCLRIMYGRHQRGILEIKNVDSLIYRNTWIEDNPPAHIELQLQAQLECIGYAWGAIAVLVGGNDARIIVRERDRAVGAAIRNRVNEFWTNLAMKKYPPATMPEDADTLRRLYNFSEPGKLLDAQGDDTVASLCREYKEAGEAEKAAKDRKDVARAYLLERIGDAEKVIASGYSISAGMVGPCDISYTREGYRAFAVYKRKEGKK